MLSTVTETENIQSHSNETPWFALQTRSRHEKVVHSELQKRGIESFLPIREVLRHWSDRKVVIESPLFGGYVFVRLPLADRIRALSAVGVVRFVGNSEPWEVPQQEIAALRRFVQEEIRVDPYPYLRAGDRVCVMRGPLRGIEGFIVRKQSKYRLVLSIDIMMQSVSVEIDVSSVEPIG